MSIHDHAPNKRTEGQTLWNHNHPASDCSNSDSDGSPSIPLHDQSLLALKHESIRDGKDLEGISLLGIIFPDASKEELEEMHYSRIHSPSQKDRLYCSACDETGEDNGHKFRKDLGEDLKLHAEQLKVIERREILESDDDQEAIDSVSDAKNTIHLGIDREQKVSPCKASDHLNSLSTPQRYKGTRYARTKQQVQLPDDFLRIPQNHALKLRNRRTGNMEWNIVAKLERDVIQSHIAHDDKMRIQLQASSAKSTYIIRTAIFRRDTDSGLGMQLREWNGFIFVNSLTCANGNRICDKETYKIAVRSRDNCKFGPAFNAGIEPGDQILGVNGIPFLRWSIQGNQRLVAGHEILAASDILANAVRIVRGTEDPIVLHIRRAETDGVPQNSTLPAAQVAQTPDYMHGRCPVYFNKGQHDDDSWTTRSEFSEKEGWQIDGIPLQKNTGRRVSNEVHPLIRQLAKSGLVRSKKEQEALSQMLDRLTYRAAMWDENSYLRSTRFRHMILYEDLVPNRGDYPASTSRFSLGGAGIGFIRQALCVHIVNTFIDKDRIAYTIWVFDVETKTEWYAPVRYFQDFAELRMATSRLNKAVERLSFPSATWFSADESSLAKHIKEMRLKQLEEFLRSICNFVYTEKLDQKTTNEIALFVQTFLGCDTQIDDLHDHDNFYTKWHDGPNPHKFLSEKEIDAFFKKAVQLYTYRLFLLPPFKGLVARFVDDVKQRTRSIEDKKIVSIGSSMAEKEKDIIELSTIQQVMGDIWQIIYQGCLDDISAIACCPEFCELGSNMSREDRISLIETNFRDAVREQIEIEVYVPIRSTISRLLVHGWRYDDKSIAYKINVLKTKSQSFFKIKEENQSPTGWRSVIDILTEGVGRSTLPCNKLKAIVIAGKEIGRLGQSEHPSVGVNVSLGADDFLPIFIYCVVNSNIDRPCALCALLMHLCDDLQKIGEVGYYLSSFEAAIMFVFELDLASEE